MQPHSNCDIASISCINTSQIHSNQIEHPTTTVANHFQSQFVACQSWKRKKSRGFHQAPSCFPSHMIRARRLVLQLTVRPRPSKNSHYAYPQACMQFPTDSHACTKQMRVNARTKRTQNVKTIITVDLYIYDVHTRQHMTKRHFFYKLFADHIFLDI